MADTDCTCFEGPYRQYHVGAGWHCAGCGTEVLSHDAARDARDVAIVRQALGPQLAVALHPAAPAARSQRRPSAAGLLSARAAAQRLGIGRDTLARIVRAGKIESVPKGARRGYRASDVERLIERGYELPEAPPVPARKPRRHRPPKAADAASIEAQLAEF